MNYELLKKVIKEKRFTIKLIAKEIGVTENGLHGMINNNTLKVRDLEKVCRVIDVDIKMFFSEKTIIENTISGGNHNFQATNSNLENFQNLDNKNNYELDKLKNEIKRLKKELQECKSDKEMFKRIIENKL